MAAPHGFNELFVLKGGNDVRRECRIGMFESVKGA